MAFWSFSSFFSLVRFLSVPFRVSMRGFDVSWSGAGAVAPVLGIRVLSQKTCLGPGNFFVLAKEVFWPHCKIFVKKISGFLLANLVFFYLAVFSVFVRLGAVRGG